MKYLLSLLLDGPGWILAFIILILVLAGAYEAAEGYYLYDFENKAAAQNLKISIESAELIKQRR